MTDTMLERIARAIERSLSREMEDDKPGLIDSRAIARAAVAAMREPSNRVIEDAGQTLSPMYSLTECYTAFREAWNEAIDAILNEGQP